MAELDDREQMDREIEETLEIEEESRKRANAALGVVATRFDRIGQKIRRLQVTHPDIAESLLRSRDNVIGVGR